MIPQRKEHAVRDTLHIVAPQDDETLPQEQGDDLRTPAAFKKDLLGGPAFPSPLLLYISGALIRLDFGSIIEYTD